MGLRVTGIKVRGYVFDLAKPSVYYRKGKRCATARPESTFCATYRFGSP